jgi:hypothetical protein
MWDEPYFGLRFLAKRSLQFDISSRDAFAPQHGDGFAGIIPVARPN